MVYTTTLFTDILKGTYYLISLLVKKCSAFFKLREELHQTFVIVTHNEELADLADRKLMMKDGRLL